MISAPGMSGILKPIGGTPPTADLLLRIPAFAITDATIGNLLTLGTSTQVHDTGPGNRPVTVQEKPGSSSGQPYYRAGPSLEFQRLSSGNTGGTISAGFASSLTGAYTIMAVCTLRRPAAGAANTQMFLRGGGTNFPRFSFDSTGLYSYVEGAGGTLTNNSYTADTLGLITATFNGASSSLRINGAGGSSVSGSMGSVVSWGSSVIGGAVQIGETWAYGGFYRDYLAFNLLTTQVRDAWESYLMAYYAIP